MLYMYAYCTYMYMYKVTSSFVSDHSCTFVVHAFSVMIDTQLLPPLQDHTVTIQSAKPFKLVYKLMSTSFQLIESVIYEQPFVLVTEVQCTSPWQLSIVSSQLEQVKIDT